MATRSWASTVSIMLLEYAHERTAAAAPEHGSGRTRPGRLAGQGRPHPACHRRPCRRQGLAARTHPAMAVPPAEAEFLFGLSFPADPSRLKLMRPAPGGRRQGLPVSSEDEIQDLVLAAGEAIENIMIHAYGGQAKGEITLAVHRLPDGIMLRLRDFAPRVDTGKIEPRPLDEVRPGGLGTHFIRAIMDDASFIPSAGWRGNLLELVKRRRNPARIRPDQSGSYERRGQQEWELGDVGSQRQGRTGQDRRSPLRAISISRTPARCARHCLTI